MALSSLVAFSLISSIDWNIFTRRKTEKVKRVNTVLVGWYLLGVSWNNSVHNRFSIFESKTIGSSPPNHYSKHFLQKNRAELVHENVCMPLTETHIQYLNPHKEMKTSIELLFLIEERITVFHYIIFAWIIHDRNRYASISTILPLINSKRIADITLNDVKMGLSLWKWRKFDL